MRGVRADRAEVGHATRTDSGAGDVSSREPSRQSAIVPGQGVVPMGATRAILRGVSNFMALQRSAGNQATGQMISGARPTAAPAFARPVVQRRIVRRQQVWLRNLLGATGGALTTQISGDPAARLMRMNMGDRMDTVASLRPQVDAFEIAVGASPGFGDRNACRIVSALEDSQTNAGLGTRLFTLFQVSVDPLIGLACLVTIDRDRVRAALQANPAGARSALTLLARRVAGVGVPAHLATANTFLSTLNTELGAPTTAGVTASTPTRETNVTHLLTPPSVTAANAAAAAAGLPPPTFVEAGYYDDLMVALHQVATSNWRQADQINRRTPMDMAAGGRVETIAAEAKRRVDALFGAFGSAVAPAMAIGVNLFDQSARPGNPWDMARYFVEDMGDPAIVAVDEAHHAFGVARANVLRADVIDHYSNTAPASGRAPAATLDATLGVGAAERESRLRLTDRMWPGMQQAGRVYLTPREGRTPAETRSLYWNLFKTCVHEYLHTTANPAYTTWYSGLLDPHHKITFQEGFTDLFTLKTWRSVFPEEVASNQPFRQTIQGAADVDLPAAAGDPPHYPEMTEAAQVESQIGLPNMRAAYFRGNTAVLGGGGLPR